MLPIKKIVILMLLAISSIAMADDNPVSTRGTANHPQINQKTSVYSALSMGTGWAITNQHIVTNYHVIAGSKNLRLVKANGTEIPLTLVLSDKKNDIAILAVNPQTTLANPLPLALVPPRLGSSVFTIGYPHPNLLGTSPKLTTGHINALYGLADDPRTYQVSVPIQSGNSGGPLLNMRGEVVGIITSKLSAKKMFEWTGEVPQNINYAVKVSLLNELVQQLETEQDVKSGGAKTEQDFETLAESVLDAVVIVAGDSSNPTSPAIRPKTEISSPKKQATAIKSPSHIAVFSYTEPGVYDEKENMAGSNTIPVFSSNTAKSIKRNLHRGLGKDIKISTFTGKRYRTMYVQLENLRTARELCTLHNTERLIASNSESNPGFHFRVVAYRVFDCETEKEFSKRFTIERDERYDQYGYQLAFLSSFKQFMDLAPFLLSSATN